MRSDRLNTSSGKYLKEMIPERICDWNYTTCVVPHVGQAPSLGDGAGVQVAKGNVSILWPDENGGLNPSTMTFSGTAQTTTTMYPQMEGDIIATDAGSTAVGFNVQLDSETTDNQGMQLHFGGTGVNANNSSKITVGTHASTIDVTFWSTDWTDWDCVVAGWRKVEAFQDGFGAAIAAETGDPGYSDMFVVGVMGATKQIQSSGGINGDTTMQVVDSTDVAVDSDNLRFKLNLNSSGVATFDGWVVNAEAGAGTLAAASAGSHTLTFDDGDVLVPFIASWYNGTAGKELLIKDIKITRTPGISYSPIVGAGGSF